MLPNYLLIIATTLLFSSPSWASIVDVSHAGSSQEDDSFSVSATISFDTKIGNVNQKSQETDLSTSYKKGLHQYIFLAERDWGSFDGTTYSDSHFLHGRYRYNFWMDLDWELFLQEDRNDFRGLANRRLAGTGVRAKFEVEHLTSFIGIAVMKELLEYTDAIPIAEKNYEHDRFSNYLGIKWKWNETINFFSSTYFQPLIDDWEDHKISSRNGINVKINDNLSLEFKASVDFDSFPPVGIEPKDRRFTQSLKITF